MRTPRRLLVGLFSLFCVLWVVTLPSRQNVSAQLAVPAGILGPTVYVANSSYFLTPFLGSGAGIVRVSVIDRTTDKVIDTVGVGVGGNDFEASVTSVTSRPDGAFVYAVVSEFLGAGGSVSVIDATTDAVVDTLTVGADPTSIAVTPDGKSAYVVNARDGTLSVIDTTTNTISNTSPIALVNPNPGAVLNLNDIAITSKGDFAVVTSSPSCGEILPCPGLTYILNLGTGVVTKAAVGSGPVALSSDGTFAFVPTFSTVARTVVNSISKLDLSTGSVAETTFSTQFAGANVSGLTLSKDDGNLYVTLLDPANQLNRITILKTSDGTQVAQIADDRIAAASSVVLAPEGKGYVGTQLAFGEGVGVLNLKNNSIAAVIPAVDPQRNTSFNSPANLVVVPASVVVSPKSQAISGSSPLSLTAIDVHDTGVNWSVNGIPGGSSAVGTISPVSSTGCPLASCVATYTPPADATSQTIVTISATSIVDPTKSDAATITVNPIEVTVTPTSTSVVASQTTSVTAVVTNDSSNGGVSWTVSCATAACGSVSPVSTSSGGPTTYTAPAAIPVPPSVKVTATSVTDPTKSGSADLTIIAGESVLRPCCSALNLPTEVTTTPGGGGTVAIGLVGVPSTGPLSTIAFSLSCQDLPVGAGCSFSNVNKAISPGVVTGANPDALITIYTSAPTTAGVFVFSDLSEKRWRPLISALALIVLGLIAAASRRPTILPGTFQLIARIVPVLALALISVSCGGFSKPAVPIPQGKATPLGAYKVKVVAQPPSGSSGGGFLQVSLIVPLNVTAAP